MTQPQEDELDTILSWDIDGQREPVIFRDEMKQAIQAYVDKKVREARIDELRTAEAENVFNGYAGPSRMVIDVDYMNERIAELQSLDTRAKGDES